MSEHTNALMAATGETDRLCDDASAMLIRLTERLMIAKATRDDLTVRWLHKRIVAIERDAQKRERGTA